MTLDSPDLAAWCLKYWYQGCRSTRRVSSHFSWIPVTVALKQSSDAVRDYNLTGFMRAPVMQTIIFPLKSKHLAL